VIVIAALGTMRWEACPVPLAFWQERQWQCPAMIGAAEHS
jgi:hypothetical protein